MMGLLTGAGLITLILLWALIIGVLAFVADFWSFATRVRQPPEEPPHAQAIVALTGGSLERLSTGVRLLEERKGERLLISGVNRIVTDAEYESRLAEVSTALAELRDDRGQPILTNLVRGHDAYNGPFAELGQTP